jgi:hypothetical protein
MNKMVLILFPLLIIISLLLGSCTAPTTEPSTTQSSKVTEAETTLQSISSELLTLYDEFGIDEDVADYILFVASLPDYFRDYALQNKLCIQDHQLTDQEKQFLQEPDKYLQQIFDSYMTEIDTIDPDLATQLKKLPYFKTIELEDVEALEDVLYLASDSLNQSILETLYGKGIERNMWPVALEALVWRGMRSDKNEFDVDDPLYGSDGKNLKRLASFQAKYNTEMDQAEPVEGKRPQVVGINYLTEPMYPGVKSQFDIRFDYILIHWVLGADAVKIWGYDESAFENVCFAHEEGLEVWLQYCPLFVIGNEKSDISVADYCAQLAEFAQSAEANKVEVLVVGHEIDLHTVNFNNETGQLKSAVDEMVRTARQYFFGLITYCDWNDPWEYSNVNWEPMDFIFPQLYKSDCLRELTDEEYLDALHRWGNKVPSKPLAISEFGSYTTSNAPEYGPCAWSTVWTQEVIYDPQTQADFIESQLRILFQANVYGIFLLCWDEGIGDHNYAKFGYGIWNLQTNEPKPSFWTVYKYYRG